MQNVGSPPISFFQSRLSAFLLLLKKIKDLFNIFSRLHSCNERKNREVEPEFAFEIHKQHGKEANFKHLCVTAHQLFMVGHKRNQHILQNKAHWRFSISTCSKQY